MRDSTLISSFYDGSCDKQIIIKDTGNQFTITDDKLITNSFTLSESLCSDVDLTLGACESSSVAFETTDTTSDLLGKTITVEIILNDDTTNPFKVGTYKIDSVTLSADKSRRSVVAYDALYDVINLDVAEWYESLTFDGMTLKTFRDTFFTHIGIQQDNVTLINDNIPVNKTITTSVMSGMDILSAICEINAVFGHINENNVFEYVSLGTTSVGTITTDKYMSATYEDYTVSTIDSVLIRTETDDVGVLYGATNPTNTLIIQGNFLVFGFNTTELREIGARIYNKCQNIPLFTPCEINTIGNLCYELGDLITVKDLSDGTFDTVILSRTFNGTKAFKDTFVTESNENREERVNGIESEYERLRGRYMLLNKSIDGINVTIGNDSSGLVHDIKVNATGLAQEISAREGLGQRVTTVEATADEIAIRMDAVERQVDGDYTSYTVTEEPDLNALGTNKPNKPSEDWCTNIPCNNTVQLGTNGVPFLYTEEDYKRNLRSMAFNMDDAITYRFIVQNGVYAWEEVADTELKTVLQEINKVKITTQGLDAELKATELLVDTKTDMAQVQSEVDTKVNAKAGEILTTVSSTYYTQASANADWDTSQSSSKVSQLTSGIKSEVSQNYVKNDSTYQSMKSTVDQTASSVTGKVWERGGSESANSFSYELTSTQFRLTSNGSEKFLCNKDGITIHGNGDFTGTINATSGKIGSGNSYFTIGGGCIKYGKESYNDSNTGVYIGTGGIGLGDNKFTVDSSGNLNAKSATIVGSITASSGYIGSTDKGFTISSNAIYNGKTSYNGGGDGIYLGYSGIGIGQTSDGASAMFSVSRGGKVIAKDIELSGKIESTSGTIGGFKIGSTSISSVKTSLDDSNNGVRIETTGISLGKSKAFYVDSEGNLTASKATIKGNITADDGKIGGFTISNGNLQSESSSTTNSIVIKGNSNETTIGASIDTTYLTVHKSGDTSLKGSHTYSMVSVTNDNAKTGYFTTKTLTATGNSADSPFEFKVGVSSFSARVSVPSIYVDKFQIGSAYAKWTDTTATYEIRDSSGYNLISFKKGETQIGDTTTKLGFFNETPLARQKVAKIASPSTATLSTVITTLNNLIVTLQNYGLIKNS